MYQARYIRFTISFIAALVILLCCLTAANAADIYVTIGPAGSLDNSGNPEYLTIEDAEANVASEHLGGSKDLVTLGNNVIYELFGQIKEQYGVKISGWTCDSTNYLRLTNGSAVTRALVYDDSFGPGKDSRKFTIKLDMVDYVVLDGFDLLANTSDLNYVGCKALDIGESDNIRVTGCVLGSSINGPTIFYNYSTFLSGSNITIANCSFTGGMGISASLGNNTNIIIRDCDFYDLNNGAVYISGGSNIEFYNNRLTKGIRGLEHAISFSSVTDLKVYNNILNTTTWQASIHITGSVGTSYIVNNTLYGIAGLPSSGMGIMIWSVGNSRLYVSNNILYVTGPGYGMFAEDFSGSLHTTCRIDNNNVFIEPGSNGYYGWYMPRAGFGSIKFCDTLAMWTAETAFDNNSITTSPEFASIIPGSPSFLHINPSSPCNGSGFNWTSQFTIDMDNETRPPSGNWAIGADEVIIIGPAVLSLQGHFGSYGASEGDFESGQWGNNSNVFFEWTGSVTSTDYYWYWGTAPVPSAGDYSATTNLYVDCPPAVDVTYYFYVIATDGPDNSLPATYTYYYDGAIPDPPNPCYCQNKIDPNIGSIVMPRFIATYQDAVGVTTEYQVQVGLDTDWTVAEMWDNGWNHTSTIIIPGENVNNIYYRGTSLTAFTTYYWRIRMMDKAGNIGQWSGDNYFSTGAFMPTAPTNPVPADGATLVPVTTNFSWDAVVGVKGYFVYYGTTSGSLTCQTVVTTNSWNPPIDLAGTTEYFWRIYAYNDAGNRGSAEWSFTTGFGKVSNPFPANGATDIPTSVTMTWNPVNGATGYWVFFGVTGNLQNRGSVTTTSYTPSSSLKRGKNYTWRIDAYSGSYVATGDEWTFKTKKKVKNSICGCMLSEDEPLTPGNSTGMLLPILIFFMCLVVMRRWT